MRRDAESQLHWTNSICQAAQPWASYYMERLLLVRFLENVTLRQILGWWVKEDGAVQQCAPQLQPPPPHWAVTRTWLRLEAQFWASSAWALSVSCLSVLLSTVTLPSPICLMNRRNYTTTIKKKRKKMTAKQLLLFRFGKNYTNMMLFFPDTTSLLF